MSKPEEPKNPSTYELAEAAMRACLERVKKCAEGQEANGARTFADAALILVSVKERYQ
jgi:hypothetical protein